MDSLTQIVLGAAVGEVVLGQKIGNKALLWGAIAGTIPDLDVFIGLVQENLYHRGFTHSFLFSFLMAPFMGYLMTLLFKKSNAVFWDWTWLYFWGFITHILLDVQTIYGTELLWPFHHRLAIGNVFVIDPMYTVPFLVCVIAVLFHKKNLQRRRFLNNLGLIVSTGYLLLTMGLKYYTFNKFSASLQKQHVAYQRIETSPTPLNAILWYATAETEDQYLIGYYSIFDKSDEIEFKAFNKNLALRKELESFPRFKALNHFSKDWYLLSKTANAYHYQNLRFGTSNTQSAAKFVSTYKLVQVGEELKVEGGFKNRASISKTLTNIWTRLKGI